MSLVPQILSATFVFLMQLGFAMLEMGISTPLPPSPQARLRNASWAVATNFPAGAAAAVSTPLPPCSFRSRLVECALIRPVVVVLFARDGL